MRYDDWDVILFRLGKESKMPFKEFKVACHVVSDNELSPIHGFTQVPVMTCFIPSLVAGAPFQISIHSWRRPDVSQFALNYSGHPELIRFEARIIMDGRFVASTVFSRDFYGPHLIANTFEPSKTGEADRLRFPPFRRELLSQNHWNPNDDVGRIKVIISEGFPRDSTSLPIERVKNVVVFSFQHAPLEILESNAIAWPNPSMWRRSSFNPSMPLPVYHASDGGTSHAHSPQRKRVTREAYKAPMMTPVPRVPLHPRTNYGGNQPLMAPYMPSASMGAGQSLSSTEPFPTTYQEMMYGPFPSQVPFGLFDEALWPGTFRKYPSDTPMPDYDSNNNIEAMHVSGPSLEEGMRAPTNTPTAGAWNVPDASFSFTPSFCLPTELPTPLTNTLLNQPVPMPMQPALPTYSSMMAKVINDNRYQGLAENALSPTSSVTVVGQKESRGASQHMFNLGVDTRPESNVPISQQMGGGHGGCKTGPSPDPLAVFTGDSSSTNSDLSPGIPDLVARQDGSCSPIQTLQSLSTNIHRHDRYETSADSPTLPPHEIIRITPSRGFTEPLGKTKFCAGEGSHMSSPCLRAGGREV